MSICEPDKGRVDETGLAHRGSMLQLQLYVNQHSDDLSERINVGLGTDLRLSWRSPLSQDNYAEYRDEGFLAQLGLENHSSDLQSFWPHRGPCWDGLAIGCDEGGEAHHVLVEAKSYPEEAKSSMRAQSPRSRAHILSSLAATAEWLGVSPMPEAWVSGQYQAANRLAHLYFLRELCGVRAELIFLHFVDDPTHRATSAAGWKLAWSRALAGLEISEPEHVRSVLVPGLPRP